MQPLTKEELSSAYADETTREKIFRLTMLSDLFRYCLIFNNYKPPSYLTEAIKLTPYGNEKVQNFARKRIPIPESRMFCFLEFSWIDLLIDVQATDVDRLQEAISRQIKERSIYYPFIFGRDLYDRAFRHANVSEDTRSLELSDTIDFLDGTPQGVFQLHEYVTGPFGLLSSKALRFYQPQRYAKLVHCSDPNCHKIHRVQFSTGRDAAINKHRTEAGKVLAKDNETPSAWASFIAQIFSDKVKPARDDMGEVLIPILGDCLTHNEIRDLTAWLLDNTQGELRETCASLGRRGKSADIVAGMGRAELMQLCLTSSDRDLTQGIDTLVHEKKIEVPRMEIRRPLVNGDISVGDFRLFAELGHLGVRIRSDRMHLAPLRLRNLIERMYRFTDVADREELEWQLRTANGATLEAQLEDYLQNRSPRSVVETLVLARKSNAVAACEVLKLREGATEDEQFIPLILWKLGFAIAATGDHHADFWRLHEDMERMVRMGPGSPLAPSVEEFRGKAANYFVSLETTLDDSIAFIVWALTNDHFADGRPFAYKPDAQRALSYEWLQDSINRTSETELSYSAKNNLHALCRGFQCTSAELKRIAIERESFRRPLTAIPEWASQQALQKFPFRHTVPFLDLTDASRDTIVDRLQEISRLLVAGNVSTARNDWLHGGREVPDFSHVRASLTAIRSAVELIEDSGFARIIFAVSGHRSDEYGRSVTTLQNVRGQSLNVNAPSPFNWLKLPSTGKAQHIMTAACFSAPGDFLRFTSEVASPFTDMWGDFPLRMEKSQRAEHALDGVSVGNWAQPAIVEQRGGSGSS